ncbi:MAG: dTDP-4-amino-4,6-dideoxygalactose transaminase [Gammaproteobacteria bacterium]|nr:dTDP-4-amino-4,6-dideoxygalactose transaminase [Gammaproteobacteria bacterium]
MRIPFHKTYVSKGLPAKISQRLLAGRLESGGASGTDCRDYLTSMIGQDNVLLTSSCTSALEAAAYLAEIGPGDEVIVPSYTFVSTVNSICRFGGVPVFVDVDSRNYCISLDEVEKALTKKTKAVIAVHYAGVSCDMDRLMQLSKLHGFKVIEDAAQALGSKYKGRSLGCIGDFGCFSFHDTKVFSAAEGGALVVRDDDTMKKACTWVDKGTNRKEFFEGKVDKYGWVGLGTSSGMDELSAVLLLDNLERCEYILSRRKQIFLKYSNDLKSLSRYNVDLMNIPAWNTVTNYHFFYMIVEDSEVAKKVIDMLKESGICAVQHYPQLHKSDYCQLKKYKSIEPFNNTDNISECIVRLPLYVDMSPDDVDEVIQSVMSVFMHLYEGM